MKYVANGKHAACLGSVTGILLFGVGIFFPQAEAIEPQPEAIECGDTLARGHHKLTADVTCSDSGESALTLEGGANLDLNGYTVNCKETGREGVELEGRNARVRNGIIRECRNGVVIKGDGYHKVLRLLVEDNERDGINVSSDNNQLVNVEARNNERRGFNIGGDDNHLVNCLAEDNGRQGFIINGGNDNEIRNSAAFRSCRDGIEIDNEGSDNSLINNYVADNGNESTCEAFNRDYLPQFYAGIDITDGANGNTVINNRTSGNLGCNIEEGQDSCVARDRNLWDENDNCASNRWTNNRVDGERAEPECG